MGSIKFVKEPGYIFSLFRIFCIYFNKELLSLPYNGYKNSDEDIEYLQEVLADFTHISDELLVFFHMSRLNIAFMTRFYFDAYRKEMIDGTYNLDTVLAALNDHEEVVRNVMRFYFLKISEETIQECLTDLKKLNKLIKNSVHKPEIKNALYEFFIDPVPAIQKLSAELAQKERLLAVQYEKKHDSIIALQNKLSYNRVISDLQQVPQEGVDLSDYSEMYVSVGVIARQVMVALRFENSVVVTVGLDYEELMERLKSENIVVELDTFGNAVSEKNRIQILEFILRKGEAAQKEVEKELGLTANNAYYHLMLMTKANLLNFRNQGRATLYRINKEYMEAVMREIEKYTK